LHGQRRSRPPPALGWRGRIRRTGGRSRAGMSAASDRPAVRPRGSTGPRGLGARRRSGAGRTRARSAVPPRAWRPGTCPGSSGSTSSGAQRRIPLPPKPRREPSKHPEAGRPVRSRQKPIERNRWRETQGRTGAPSASAAFISGAGFDAPRPLHQRMGLSIAFWRCPSAGSGGSGGTPAARERYPSQTPRVPLSWGSGTLLAGGRRYCRSSRATVRCGSNEMPARPQTSSPWPLGGLPRSRRPAVPAVCHHPCVALAAKPRSFTQHVAVLGRTWVVPPSVFGLPPWRVLPLEGTIAVARERPRAGRTAVAPNATGSRWLRNSRSPIRSMAKIDNALYPELSGWASSSSLGWCFSAEAQGALGVAPRTLLAGEHTPIHAGDELVSVGRGACGERIRPSRHAALVCDRGARMLLDESRSGTSISATSSTALPSTSVSSWA
jgi:hypothetical protein